MPPRYESGVWVTISGMSDIATLPAGRSHLRFFLSSVQLSTDSHSLAFAGTRPTSTGGTALWAPAGGRVTFLLRDKKVTKESRPASSAWLRQAPLPLPLPAGRRCNSPTAQIVSPSTAGLPRPSRTSLGDSEGEKGTPLTLRCLSGSKEIQMRLPWTLPEPPVVPPRDRLSCPAVFSPGLNDAPAARLFAGS